MPRSSASVAAFAVETSSSDAPVSSALSSDDEGWVGVAELAAGDGE